MRGQDGPTSSLDSGNHLRTGGRKTRKIMLANRAAALLLKNDLSRRDSASLYRAI